MSSPASPVLTAETDELLMAYEASGPESGPPVLLLHGWPDDIRTWDVVAGYLSKAGYRVIVPYLRGFGPTRFRHASAPRIAQPTALSLDIVQLLDALNIEKATVIGHDWGGRIGYTLGALWPERVARLCALSVGYETGVQNGATLEYKQQHAYWYQWFFASERGREALSENRQKLGRYLWETWAPSMKFTEEEFVATATSWDNPDWVDVTLHSYRTRWGNAELDPRYSALEEKLKKHPAITVPTTVLHGEQDGASLSASSAGQESSFTGGYHRHVLPGVGHFIPRERPEAIIAALVDEG